ncbi:baculoviral IAP repeat-containing protein 7-A-like [Tetranychus urticae]|uniref:RING-type domain-containing protein n=1 Tax=Tetranychus urticae TaxID=32264 RepID=T1KA94_TETUR|nr:baculoviral IAP repeat-containing protein 7-A-like [Tetranychus urticae]
MDQVSENHIPDAQLILDVTQLQPLTVSLQLFQNEANDEPDTYNQHLQVIHTSITSSYEFTCFSRDVEAQYPDYITLESRLSTYETWTNENKSPSELAQAGFLFIGETDTVVCFHCGIHIQNWIPDDDIWVAHAICSPWCTYLYIKCGISFIRSCLKAQTVKRSDTPLLEPSNNRYVCKVCLEKEVGVCFYPCEHTVTCINCAPGIASCPICRSKIIGVFKLKFID